MERFEPIGSARRMGGLLFLQSLLLAHQPGLFCGKGLPVNQLVEEGVQKLLDPGADLLDFRLLLVCELRGGLGDLLLFLLNPFKHLFRPIRPQRKRFKEFRDLAVQDFFAHVGLDASDRPPAFLRAAVIRVALLDLCRDGATTSGTAQEPHVGFGLRCRFRGSPAPSGIDDVLNLVEKALGDERLVLTLVHLSSVFEVTVIKGIGEETRHVDTGKRFPVPRANPLLREEFPHIVEIGLAARIRLKGLFDDGCPFVVEDDRLRPVIVQVSYRGRTRIFSATNLLAQSTLGVLGQGVHVVLALPEHDGEHELPLRIRFEAEGGEAEGFDHSCVEEINDLAAIDAVSRQAVRMPSEYSFGFASLDPGEHIVENRPPGPLGRLFLDQFGSDGEAFTRGKFPQLVELRFYREDLLFLDIGGFASVEKQRTHGA